MRFDATEYVDTWKATGRFPAIHDRITALVREEVSPSEGTVLDLCASTGLLGRRLADCGYTVTAVQEPGPATMTGVAAGVYDPVDLLALRIAPDTVGEFLRHVEDHEVRTIVARRCFPELWEALSDVEFGVMARGLVDAGVRRIVLEGRVASHRSTHPLATAAHEVTALAPAWRPVRVTGPFAVCVPD